MHLHTAGDPAQKVLSQGILNLLQFTAKLTLSAPQDLLRKATPLLNHKSL